MLRKLKILALEAYYGGSHKAFLDTWVAHSQHEWSLSQLPAYKWKWRMRHAAITFADERRDAEASQYDLLFCSDMMNLAEFRGLAPPALARLPSVLYFHENQLTYPTPQKDPRDHHYAFTNLISALAADAVWFNSEHHRTSLLDALVAFLRKMPDHQQLEWVERIRCKSSIWPPGADLGCVPGPREPGPLRLGWVARWEADKNPDDFFSALFRSQDAGLDFRVSVVGESFQNVPPIFAEAKRRLAHRIDHWGYCPSRADYERVLRATDVVVSTAIHEFFGIAVVEAVMAGAVPLLPPRLSYPEIFAPLGESLRRCCFYDGSVRGLVASLKQLNAQLQDEVWRDAARGELLAAMEPFRIRELARKMDAELTQLTK